MKLLSVFSTLAIAIGIVAAWTLAGHVGPASDASSPPASLPAPPPAPLAVPEPTAPAAPPPASEARAHVDPQAAARALAASPGAVAARADRIRPACWELRHAKLAERLAALPGGPRANTLAFTDFVTRGAVDHDALAAVELGDLFDAFLALESMREGEREGASAERLLVEGVEPPSPDPAHEREIAERHAAMERDLAAAFRRP